MVFFSNKQSNEFTPQTTNSSWTNISAIPVDQDKTVIVELYAVARRADNADCAYWQQSGLFRRDGTEVVTGVLGGLLNNVINPIKTLGAALWDVRARLESDGYIYLDVKGGTSVTVDWTVVLEHFEQ